MTHDDEQGTDRDTWIYLWRHDRDHPLTRFCLWVSIAAIIGWFLIRMLTP